VVLTEGGELVLVEPNPAAYTEIARYQALAGTSWNHPAFSNGRIYARSNTQIVALDVAAAVAPLPELRLSVEPMTDWGRLKFRVITTDNSPLTAQEVSRVELQLAPPPSTGAPNWQPVDVTFSATDGALYVELPSPADSTFVRVTERRLP
jgi:hypothetical protein